MTKILFNILIGSLLVVTICMVVSIGSSLIFLFFRGFIQHLRKK